MSTVSSGVDDVVRTPRRAKRRFTVAGLGTIALLLLGQLAGAAPAQAVTTGNGALVYSPAAGSSFNPEGGRAAGTTYAKNLVLKNSGTADRKSTRLNSSHLDTSRMPSSA